MSNNQKIKKGISLTLASIALVFASQWLVSCSKSDAVGVDEEKIYTVYELAYNKTSDKSSISAAFRLGGSTGTLLQLTSTSSVSFNSDVLGYNSFLGWHFKEAGGIINGGTFVYKSMKGNLYTNTLPGLKPVAIASSVDTIKKNQTSYTFTWIGDPLGPDESIALTVYNYQNNSWIWTQNTLGATNVVLDAQTLSKFNSGLAVIAVDRYYAPSLQQKTSIGGELRSKYTVTKNIYIK